jgi:hypothetical protein
MRPSPLIDLRPAVSQQLFLLGGVPRAGKTLLSRRLWQQFQLPGLNIDSIVMSFMKLAPEAGISWHASSERAEKILEVVANVASWSLATFDRYCIEGESITPYIAHAASGSLDVRSCFLTMRNPDIEAIIAYEGPTGWVKDLAESEYEGLIKDLIFGSEWLEDQCRQYDLPCIDVTFGNYEDRIHEALALLDPAAMSRRGFSPSA